MEEACDPTTSMYRNKVNPFHAIQNHNYISACMTVKGNDFKPDKGVWGTSRTSDYGYFTSHWDVTGPISARAQTRK